MQNCLGHSEGVGDACNIEGLVLLVFFELLVLLQLNLLKMVLFDFFKVVVATEYHFFAFEAHPHGVGGSDNLLDALRLAFESVQEEVGELEGRKDLHYA